MKFHFNCYFDSKTNTYEIFTVDNLENTIGYDNLNGYGSTLNEAAADHLQKLRSYVNDLKNFIKDANIIDNVRYINFSGYYIDNKGTNGDENI